MSNRTYKDLTLLPGVEIEKTRLFTYNTSLTNDVLKGHFSKFLRSEYNNRFSPANVDNVDESQASGICMATMSQNQEIPLNRQKEWVHIDFDVLTYGDENNFYSPPTYYTAYAPDYDDPGVFFFDVCIQFRNDTWDPAHAIVLRIRANDPDPAGEAAGDRWETFRTHSQNSFYGKVHLEVSGILRLKSTDVGRDILQAQVYVDNSAETPEIDKDYSYFNIVRIGNLWEWGVPRYWSSSGANRTNITADQSINAHMDTYVESYTSEGAVASIGDIGILNAIIESYTFGESLATGHAYPYAGDQRQYTDMKPTADREEFCLSRLMYYSEAVSVGEKSEKFQLSAITSYTAAEMKNSVNIGLESTNNEYFTYSSTGEVKGYAYMAPGDFGSSTHISASVAAGGVTEGRQTYLTTYNYTDVHTINRNE